VKVRLTGVHYAPGVAPLSFKCSAYYTAIGSWETQAMMSRVDILQIQHFTVDKDNWPPVGGGYLNLTVPTRRLIRPPHCLQHHTPSRFCTKASPWGDVSWRVSVGYHIWDSNWEFRKDNSVVVLWCRARRITLWHFGSTSSTFRRVCCYYVWYGSDNHENLAIFSDISRRKTSISLSNVRIIYKIRLYIKCVSDGKDRPALAHHKFLIRIFILSCVWE